MESSPSEGRPRGILGVIPLVILVATLMADQVTKGLVVLAMSPGQSVPGSGLFRFTYVTNTGSAFGLFPNQTVFLVLASFVGIGVLLVFYRTHPLNNNLLHASLGLQLGGALGNLVDRVRLGYVVDFIDVGAWPVFNLADSAIVVGLIGLLWTLATTKDKDAPEPEPMEDGVLLPVASGEEGTMSGELDRASVDDDNVPERREKPVGVVRRLVADLPGERLDKFLALKQNDLSRAHISGLVARGLVTVNGATAKSSYRLKGGELVKMEVAPPPPTTQVPQDIPLTVVYEDGDLLVVDKPAGMVAHPAPGHPLGTLVNALLARLPDLGGVGEELRPGIVHRLDKDTSGLMVVAKNRQAHDHVSRQIKDRDVRKVYIALATGTLEPAEGIIQARIGRDPRNRKRMAVVERGREAETSFRVLERLPDFTLVEAFPKTGRTHQIRVHFSSLGHPMAGDTLYGGKDPRLDRQFLHAHVLGFRLPATGEYMEFTSPLPAELSAFLVRLRGDEAEVLHGRASGQLAGRL